VQKTVYGIILVALTFGLFSKTLRHDFLQSDRETLGLAQSAVEQPHDRLVALTNAVPTIIWKGLLRVGEPKPQYFHLINLLFHTSATLFLFLTLTLLFRNFHGAAFMGGWVYAVHPLNLEAVAAIHHFPIVAAGAFSFAAIWFYLCYVQKRDLPSRHVKPLRRYYAATVCFALATLSHPIAIACAPMALLLERVLPSGRSSLLAPRRPVWPVLVWLAIAAPTAIITAIDQVGFRPTPIFLRPLIASDALVFQLIKFVFPMELSADYGRNPLAVAHSWTLYTAWLVPILGTLLLMYWRERARAWIAAGIGLATIGLLPTLGFVSYSQQAVSTVADRYSYLALFGLAIIVSYLATLRRNTLVGAVLLLSAVGLSYQTFSMASIWRNDEALWSHTLKVNPNSLVAHRLLADAAFENGDLDAADKHYQTVLAQNPQDAVVHARLGQTLLLRHEYAKALAAFSEALRLRPEETSNKFAIGLAKYHMNDHAGAFEDFSAVVSTEAKHAEAHYYRGACLVALDRFSEAAESFQSAISNRDLPNELRADALALMGLTQFKLNQHEDSERYLAEALRLSKDHARANRTLADVYFQQGKFAAAEHHYKLAAQDADPTVVANLGTIYLNAEKYDAAASELEKAAELKKDDAHILANLGIAYFNLKRFDEAIEKFNATLAINPQSVDAIYYLGDTQRRLGKSEDALSYYYSALKIDPTHSKSHYRLGLHFFNKDSGDRALYHLRAANKASPEDRRILGSLQSAEQKYQ
jgi:protein O-mannosyl-transferase